MNFKKALIALLILLSISTLQAQKFELGKVSIAELEEKVHSKDTAAVAAILFKKGEVTFDFSQNNGFQILTKVSTRIKIYKKEGYEWANQKVSYYIDYKSKESVSFSDVATYNLVNGKIEKTKLKSDGEFNEIINKYWGQKKITLPNVKVGSVIEFEYVIKSTTIGSLKEWNFQSNIPVNYNEYITYIPEYFVYKPSPKGYFSPTVTVTNGPKSISINTKERSIIGKPIFTSEQFDYIETITTYKSNNLPSIKEEAYVNNIENYSSSIANELSMIKYPGRSFENFSTNWEAVAKTIYDYDDFGPELNKSGYFEDDLKPLLTGLNSTDEIIALLLNYVKTTVKWNNYNGYSCIDGVKQAYKSKTGNSAEINLMLTAMLRYAGLTANPVLVSTRDNGIAIFPNRNAFNYVITAVETPNGFILLDASDKFSTPNVLPFRTLNWVGRLIRKDGTSEEVDLMPKVASNNTIMMSYSVDATGLVSGKVRRQRTGHNAFAFRSETENVKEDAYHEKLENENKKIEISDYSRANEKEIQLPVTETFSFSGTNLSEIIGGKIYLNPMLFFTEEQNPFKQENRQYPIDYGFPFMDKYSINIQIPEGYKLETLPETKVFSMQDDLGSFKFLSSLSGNTIQLSVSHQVNTSIISTEYYSMLKEYYQKMIAKQNEKIILTKI